MNKLPSDWSKIYFDMLNRAMTYRGIKKGEDIDVIRTRIADIKAYENAMATGNFKRAAFLNKTARLAERVAGNLEKQKSLQWITNSSLRPLLSYLRTLEHFVGNSLNTPLLEIFGPVQMNETMRKTRGRIDRRKYLVDEGA